jgi:O-antigen/teichoic acid export membrane protein
MQWLLVAVLARSVSVPAENILYATGCVPMAARLSVIESTANLALGLALVAGYGAAGLAFATAVTHWCAATGWWLQAGCRAAKVPVRAVVGHMTRAAAVPALAMLAVVVPYLLWAAPVAPVAQILVGASAGSVYLAVWLLRTGIPMFRAGILPER